MNNTKHIQEGDKYMKLSKDEQNKFNFIFNRTDNQKVIEYLNKSAESYLLGKDDLKGIESYLLIVKYILNKPSMINRYTSNLFLSYIELCNKCKINVDVDAFNLLKKIINELNDNNMISKILKNLAFNYEITGNIDKAIEYYEESVNYAELCKIKCFSVVKKIAELGILSNNYLLASNKYKECANFTLISKFQVADCLLYYLILKMESLNEEQFNNELNYCVDLCPLFSYKNDSYNYSHSDFACGLFTSIKTQNKQYIETIISNKYRLFDIHITKVLKNILNKFTNQEQNF